MYICQDIPSEVKKQYKKQFSFYKINKFVCSCFKLKANFLKEGLFFLFPL